MNVWPMMRPLLLRILDAGQRVEEALRRVDRHELDAEVRAERPLDLLALVQPQQTRVDEDAGELVADRAMHQRRRDRRVDAARQPADHARVADERRGSSRSRSSMNAPGVQLGSALADVEQEVRDDLAAARRVRDLGMELHAVDRLASRAAYAAIGDAARSTR